MTFEDRLTQATSTVDGLTALANKTTGVDDENIADAIFRLIAGYGGGGDVKPWRFIKALTVTDATQLLETDVDEDGNSFSLEDVFIYAPLGVKTSANSQFQVYLNRGLNTGLRFSGVNNQLGTANKSLYWYTMDSPLLGFQCSVSAYEIAGVGNATFHTRLANVLKSGYKISKIGLMSQDGTTFTDGTFHIYGR